MKAAHEFAWRRRRQLQKRAFSGQLLDDDEAYRQTRVAGCQPAASDGLASRMGDENVVGPDQPLADFAPGVDWWVARANYQYPVSSSQYCYYGYVMLSDELFPR